MKKIMSWILLVAMLLGMFAGCGKSQDPTQPSTDPVEIPEITATGENNALDVVNYLQAIYKDSGAKTAGNFERFGIVRIAGVPYEVVWTADVGEDLVKIIVNDDGTVTIDVNEKCPEDTIYVLTATITDANGNTETASWEYLLPGTASLEEMQATVDEAYALEKGEALSEERVLSGVIKSIDTPYSDQYQNITVTIQVEGREDKPIQCYRLKGEGAAELNPGDTITVQGLLKNYNGTIEFDAGCQLTSVEKTGTPVVIPTDHHQILQDVYALGDNESLPYGPITLTGRICAIDTPYSEQYKNITVSIIIDWYTIKCYRLKGEGCENLEMNDIITVKGYIKKYNGTREFDVPELLEVVKVGEVPQPADQLHVAKVAYALDPGWTVPYGDVTLTGTVTKGGSWSSKYENITVTFTVDGDTKGEYPIECYRMTYGEDASKELKAAVEAGIEKGDKITVKGILMKYQYVPSGDTKVELNCPEILAITKAPKEESNLTATLTTSLKTGDKVVIAAPAYNMALSSEYTGHYNKGQQITIEKDVAKGFTEAEIWTVTVNSDGSYSFSVGGQKLSMDTEYSSMPLGKVNDKWALETVTSGVYKVKNIGRNSYIEWYQDKNNWSSYYNASSDLFHLSFYKYEGELGGDGGEGGDTGNTDKNVYTKITSASDFTSGSYVMIVSTGYAPIAVDGTWISTAQPAVEGNKVTDSKGGVWTLTVDGSNVSITDANGKTIKPKGGNNNGLSTGTYNWSWTHNNDGTFTFNGVGSDTVTLASNTNTDPTYGGFNRFRGYKNGTVSGNPSTYPCNFTLYKLGADGGSGDEGGETGPTIVANAPLLTKLPVDGDVIAIANGTNALTETASGKKLGAEAATVSDGKLAVTNTIAQLTVSVDANGYYTFTSADGKYLTSGSTGNSLTMAASASDYSLWTVESAGSNKWYIKNVNAKYNGNIQSLEYYSGFTTFGHKTTSIYQMELYLIKAAPVYAPVMSAAPGNGDVIAIVNDTNAMTGTASGKKLAAEAVTITDNKLVVTDTLAQLSVSIDANGYYTFTSADGKYLTSGATGNSLTMAASASDYSLWTVESAGSNKWYIKNVNAKYNGNIQSLEYYSGFTTFGHKTTSIYQMELYLIKAGSGSVTPPVNNDPAADSELTISSANELGSSKQANVYTTAKYYVSGSIVEILNDETGYMMIEDAEGISMIINGVYDATGAVKFNAMNPQPKAGDTIKAYGVIGNDGYGPQMKDAWVTITATEDGDEGGSETPAEPTTVTVKISDYASANGWVDGNSNGQQYKEVKMDDNITITLTSATTNSGKYYSSSQWRIYQSEGTKINFAAANGKTIVSIKITYSLSNGGTITLNGTNYASGATISVDAASVALGVASTTGKANGQARITAIEVIYK